MVLPGGRQTDGGSEGIDLEEGAGYGLLQITELDRYKRESS